MTKYYKFTNLSEYHNRFQYEDGLNVDIVPFNSTDSCCAGGLYFSDSEHIMQYFDNEHNWIREVSIPEGETEFIQDPDKNFVKWRSHSLICKKRKCLRKLSTWKWMQKEGFVFNDNTLYMNAVMQQHKIVRCLLALKDIEFSNKIIFSALSASTYNGYLEMTQILLNYKKLILDREQMDSLLYWSTLKEQTEVVKYLLNCKKLRFSINNENKANMLLAKSTTKI